MLWLLAPLWAPAAACPHGVRVPSCCGCCRPEDNAMPALAASLPWQLCSRGAAQAAAGTQHGQHIAQGARWEQSGAEPLRVGWWPGTASVLQRANKSCP